MKKLTPKRIASTLLSLALMASALTPAVSAESGVSPPASVSETYGTPAKNLDTILSSQYLLNGCYDMSGITDGGNTGAVTNATVELLSDRTVFGEGDGYAITFPSGSKNVFFDIKSVSGYTGVAAYTFQVNNAGGAAVTVRPTLHNLNGWEIQFSAFNAKTNDDKVKCILLSSDGTVDTVTTYNNGYITIPAGFVGSVVLPVTATNSTNYNLIGSFRLMSSAASSLKINNISAIYSTDKTVDSLGTAASTNLGYRPVVEIPESADIADITWNAVNGATGYTVNLFSLTAGKTYLGSYSFNTSCSTSTNTAAFSGLVPGLGYAVQIKAFSGDTLLSVSELKEFVAEKRSNYNLLNDLSRAESVSSYDTLNSSSIFENVSAVTDSTIFPDGKGVAFKNIYRLSSFAFELDKTVDISQFDGFSYYFAKDSRRANMSFRNWTDQDGNNIVDVSNANTTVRCISATTAAQSTATKGNEPHYLTYSTNKSYFLIDTVSNNYRHNVSSVVLNTTQSASFAVNNFRNNYDAPFYIDNIAVVDNIDMLYSTSTSYADIEEFGLLLPTTATVPTFNPTISASGVSGTISWSALSSTNAYKVYVYTCKNGDYSLYDTKTVTGATSTTLNLELGYDYAIQVTGKNTAGKYTGVYTAVSLDTTEYLPDVLGATFTELNDFRFTGLSPSQIFTNCNVEGYGLVMIPESLLTGELTLDTPYAVNAGFEDTPALGSEFYGTLTTQDFNIDSNVVARSYVTYSDLSGNEFTVYSDEAISRSISGMARDIAKSILTYKTSTDKAVWTAAVPNTTTVSDVDNLSSAAVREFALQNTAAATDAYARILADKTSSSALSLRSEFAYIYEADNYTYGITEDFREIISYKTDDNEDIDILKGAGEYNILGTKGGVTTSVFKNAGVKSFSQSLNEKGQTTLTVTYKTTGETVAGANMSTTYTFKENGINVKAYAKYSNSQYNLESYDDIAASKRYSILKRDFIKTYESVERNWNTNWEYPENGDAPFKTTESWVHEYKYPDNLYVYSFMRGENCPETLRGAELTTALDKNHLFTYFTEGSSIDYCTEYDLVMFESYSDDTAVIREKALFMGLDSDYSVRISASEKDTGGSYATSDNTTVFTGDTVKLDVKLTGIKEAGANPTVNYTVYDYDGTLVANEVKTPSLAKGSSVNYSLEFQNTAGNRGIYFMNLTVSTASYTHTEFFPFALVEDHNFTPAAMNSLPFGISQFLSEDNVNFDDQWAIVQKLGVAKNRSLFMQPANKYDTDLYLGVESSYSASTYLPSDLSRNISFLERMKQAGVKTTMLKTPDPNMNDTKLTVASTLIGYADYYLNGNELNLAVLNEGKTYATAFSNLTTNYHSQAKTFLNAYNTQNSTNIGLATAGISYGDLTWFDMLNGENGGTDIWDDYTAVSMHTYSTSTPQLHNRFKNWATNNAVWNIEASLNRTRQQLDKYGDKFLIVDETGTYTGANNLNKASLRMHGEFNIQSYMLALSYGAEWVSTYCAFDYAGHIYGTTTDASHSEYMEFHYGNFYYPDYYGRILPKPAAVAYANMTRRLEGYQSLEEVGTSGTAVTLNTDADAGGYKNARAFAITVKDPNTANSTASTVYVAWSIKGITYTSDETGYVREAKMPWVSDWDYTGTTHDTITIQTSASSVTVYDMMGNSTTVNASNGAVTIPLTGEPCYIVGA